MTKDDIIKLAREAGFERVVAIYSDGSKIVTVAPVLELERFANLVAAAEREACAKVCESLPVQQDRDVRDECAAVIRARGNA
jgi:hypothetical protein